jgi:hypothetical protein
VTRRARVRVVGRIDQAQSATVTIDSTAGLISVRPFRRHREYTLPLMAVAQDIVYRVVRAELSEKRKRRKNARRGMLRG